MFLKNTLNNTLRVHEVGVVYLFIAFFILLSRFTLKAPDEKWPHNAKSKVNREEQIVISIDGHPDPEASGRFHFSKGTTVEQVLAELGLKGFKANAQGMVKCGQRLKIKKMNKSLEDK